MHLNKNSTVTIGIDSPK